MLGIPVTSLPAVNASLNALATLLFAWPLARAKLATRRQTKRIAQLEQEIHGLRTLPIASESVTSSTPPRV